MEMAIITDRDLDGFMDQLRDLVNQDMDGYSIRTLRFCVEGGLKFKVNGGCWSPPIGRLAQDGY